MGRGRLHEHRKKRVWARPTLEVCGILSGYTGLGSKAVLPSKAMAKISCRLVPDQDPLEVYTQLKAYLDAHVPPTVKYELEDMVSGQATISDRQSPRVHAIEKAMQSVLGRSPGFNGGWQRAGSGAVPELAGRRNWST